MPVAGAPEGPGLAPRGGADSGLRGASSTAGDEEYAAGDLFEDDGDGSGPAPEWEVVRWAPESRRCVLPEVSIPRHLVQCWASARMLAEWVLGPGQPLVGVASVVLELGASLGLPSLAASLAGSARVLATDLYPGGKAEALEVTIEYNRFIAAATGADDLFRGVSSRRLDWDEALDDDLCGVADVVLCADVIYARRAAPAIAETAGRLLRPGGKLVFASRTGRVGLDLFLAAATASAELTSSDSSPPTARFGGGLVLRSDDKLSSESMGLAMEDGEEHRLWLFEKPCH